MSSEFLRSLIFLGLLLGGMWVIAAAYMRHYRAYVGLHLDETRKLTEAQEATRTAVDRQTAALERIATALEGRQNG